MKSEFRTERSSLNKNDLSDYNNYNLHSKLKI